MKFSDKGEIKLECKTMDESGLVIQVKDEGIGIDSKHAKEIFNNFYQVESGHNRTYEGIGLGLSYARKIVHLMDGNIWFESNEKGGSTFYIHLPNCVR